MDVKLNVFKEDDNKEFRLMKNLTRREADFNQCTQMKNQLVSAAQNFVREENISPVVIPTLSKDMDGRLKLAHNLVDVVDWANRKICVTLLRYSVNKPENFYAQFQIFARRKEKKKFQQIV